MNENDKTVLVTGVTGQQGGAVARHLLVKGFHVRGLSRDPGKPAARAVAGRGIEIVAGDMEDRVALERALAGAYGVFGVQNFWTAGVEAEVVQGKTLGDAAAAAGVQHFVYNSVGGAERHTGIPHFDSKWQIEEHLRALGLPLTVFRPVFFMDNFNWSRPQILNGVLPGLGLPPDKPLQMIAVDDIGALVAMAFADPAGFIGTAIELAGDELTEPQTAATFARVIGRPVKLEPRAGQGVDAEREKMHRWFSTAGYEADIPVLRRWYPELCTFETWLHRTGWEHAQPEASGAGQQGR
jgi:uncharacterized protein YbjT (DUF2867 family)